jgi:hypothetical protein
MSLGPPSSIHPNPRAAPDAETVNQERSGILPKKGPERFHNQRHMPDDHVGPEAASFQVRASPSRGTRPVHDSEIGFSNLFHSAGAKKMGLKTGADGGKGVRADVRRVSSAGFGDRVAARDHRHDFFGSRNRRHAVENTRSDGETGTAILFG